MALRIEQRDDASLVNVVFAKILSIRSRKYSADQLLLESTKRVSAT